MKLGTESRNKTIWAAVLGALAVLAFFYEIVPMLSGPTVTTSANSPVIAPTTRGKNQKHITAASGAQTKKAPASENLDPTLQLQLLAASEQIKYEGSGRNIFVAQAEVVQIPKPKAPGVTDAANESSKWKLPIIPTPPPIPLKFFGFANQPGEPRRIFLSKDGDVFIAGEGEIVDRRYKVLRITSSSVEIQDVVNSGPPQNIPLTQG